MESHGATSGIIYISELCTLPWIVLHCFLLFALFFWNFLPVIMAPKSKPDSV